MLIKVSKDLKKQQIWATGVELASIMGKDRVKGQRVITYPENKKLLVAEFKNPVLMTDTYQIWKQPPTLRDTLFALYSSKPRYVEYDGVQTYWDQTHVNVWCPSIDTILMAKAVGKILKNNKTIKTAVEIGCGSGFISKYILAKGKNLKSMLINDINPYAIKSAKDNIKDKRAKYYVGNGIKKIQNKKFDLIICNPPYVPRPNSIDDNPYEGTGLLRYLLHEGAKHLTSNGVLVTNISNLCENLVLDEKPSMKMRKVESMKVPLKVNNILNNPNWVNYLLQKQGLQKKMVRGYEYWQRIDIVALNQ
jgi:SAM-dependent methyltransferase